MKENKFKIGDKCYHVFELVTITDIRNGVVTGVENDYVNRGGHDLPCFPDNEHIKILSDIVLEKYNNIKEHYYIGINWPDLLRKLESKWIELCECSDELQIFKLLKALDNFVNDIILSIENVKKINIDGLDLFKR